VGKNKPYNRLQQQEKDEPSTPTPKQRFLTCTGIWLSGWLTQLQTVCPLTNVPLRCIANWIRAIFLKLRLARST